MSAFNGKKPMSPRKDRFFEFIYDRHLIYHKRFIENKARPWTKDAILHNHKFCNVYRELDWGTIHIIKYIIKNKSLSLEDKLLNIILYRRFNVDYFFTDIVPPQSLKKYDWKALEVNMDRFKQRTGKNLFNSAYIVCQRRFVSRYRPRDKHVQQLIMVDSIRQNISALALIVAKLEMRNVFHILKETPMTGDFLAYQYLTDCTYLPELRNKWSVNSFTVLGKGSKPGICYIYDVELSEKNPYEKWCKHLWSIQEQEFVKLKNKKKKDWSKIYNKKAYFKNMFLSISNIQNSLCEFRKYEAYNSRGGLTCKTKKYK